MKGGEGGRGKGERWGGDGGREKLEAGVLGLGAREMTLHVLGDRTIWVLLRLNVNSEGDESGACMQGPEAGCRSGGRKVAQNSRGQRGCGERGGDSWEAVNVRLGEQEEQGTARRLPASEGRLPRPSAD